MRLRVLRHPPDDGAVQMATDEALLESATTSAERVTLRLYRFARPTMTIGYAQPLETACRVDACVRERVPVVRRPTGGRALLHEHETTYSVTGPGLATSPRAAYEIVTGTLARGLESLGIATDRALPTGAGRASAALPCLAAPTGHELGAGGRKLVPSAMRFRRDGILLHGSLLWRVDEERWRRLTHLPRGGSLPAVGLEELGVPAADEDRLADALIAAFEETFAARAEPAELDAPETERARELTAKYRSEAWTGRRRTGRKGLADGLGTMV